MSKSRNMRGSNPIFTIQSDRIKGTAWIYSWMTMNNPRKGR